MHHQRQHSSLSSTSSSSGNTKKTFRSASSSNPSQLSPTTVHQVNPDIQKLSDRPSHKRNRFRTLFFTPTIRDSGVLLNAATHDPRLDLQMPSTPPLYPPTPKTTSSCGDPFFKDELDYLDELTDRFSMVEENNSTYSASDRGESPTLGSFTSSWSNLSKYRSASSTPSTTYPAPGAISNGKTSPLPGASLHNSRLSCKTSTFSDKQPQVGLPEVFRSLALTDANVTGQPIRFSSSGYKAGSNGLRIGSCTFLDLSYGADVECGLRVEPLTNNGTHQDVILQIVQRVVKAEDGKTAWLLCSETDVSSAFRLNVRHELAERMQRRRMSQSLRPVRHTSGQSSNEPVDALPRVNLPFHRSGHQVEHDIWLSLGSTLSPSSSPSLSSTHLPIPSFIPSPVPSPALTDLLSLLTELRFLHRHFFILRPQTSVHDIEISMPHLSSSLFSSLSRQTKTSFVDQGETNKMLVTFTQAVMSQVSGWTLDSAESIFRARLILPSVPGFADRQEEMGLVGVWVDEGIRSNDRRLMQGYWVCFVVGAGAEDVL